MRLVPITSSGANATAGQTPTGFRAQFNGFGYPQTAYAICVGP